MIVANEDAFLDRNLEKAGYQANPLVDGIARRATRCSRSP